MQLYNIPGWLVIFHTFGMGLQCSVVAGERTPWRDRFAIFEPPSRCKAPRHQGTRPCGAEIPSTETICAQDGAPIGS